MVLIRNRLHAFIYFFSFLCALHSFIKTAFVFVLFLCRFYCGYAFTTKINRLLVNVNICFIQTEVKRDNKKLGISTQNSFSIFLHVWYPPCNWIADTLLTKFFDLLYWILRYIDREHLYLRDRHGCISLLELSHNLWYVWVYLCGIFVETWYMIPSYQKTHLVEFCTLRTS